MTTVTLPPYARWAATAGRPVVLVAALAMSAPGEYDLARYAGWGSATAALMPVVVSAYAAVAAVIAAARPAGTPGRSSALWGAMAALGLALAAQVVAHLIAAGHMTSGPWLVGATSAVPPLVVAHMLHLAATPKAVTEEAPATPVAIPEPPATEPVTEVDTEPEADTTTATNEEVATPPDNVVDMADAPSRKATSRGRTVEQIQEAVDYLMATGQDVNGTTYSDYVGVSARTGRRDLARIGITTAA